MPKIKILTVAELPPDLTNAWLQHLRDFDIAHPDCHFRILADAGSMTMSEVLEALKIDPELTINEIISRGPKK